MYNGVSGTRLLHVDLDSLIAPSSTKSTSTPIAYSDLIWSPDGNEVALRYQVYSSTATTGVVAATTGVVVLDENGHAVHISAPLPITVDNTPSPDGSNITSVAPLTVIQWDARSGNASLVTLPQAEGYAWGTGDSLTSAHPSASVVGRPDGGGGFSMWQSGTLTYPRQSFSHPVPGGTQLSYCAVASFVTASFGTSAAWSPDGQRLVLATSQPLGLAGRLDATSERTPAELASGCADPVLEHVRTLISPRDAATTTVIGTLGIPQLNPFDPTFGPDTAQITWSPDGRRVAVNYTGAGPVPSAALTIYDSARGTVTAKISWAYVSSLAGVPTPTASDVQLTTMAWSPDGTRLLALDATDGLLLVVGAKTLGG